MDQSKTAKLLRELSAGRSLQEAADRTGCDRRAARRALLALADGIEPRARRESRPKAGAKNSAAVAFIDGCARGNPGPAGCGLLLTDADGRTLSETGRFLGIMTNNEAEYNGLVAALETAAQEGVKHLEVRSDSELLVRQMTGDYKVKAKNLIPLFIRANQLIKKFAFVRFVHVPREQNRDADRLANQAVDLARERTS